MISPPNNSPQESPGSRVYGLAELRALSDAALCAFYDEAAALTKSPNRGVWALALINKQKAAELIQERAAQSTRQLSIFQNQEN